MRALGTHTPPILRDECIAGSKKEFRNSLVNGIIGVNTVPETLYQFETLVFDPVVDHGSSNYCFQQHSLTFVCADFGYGRAPSPPETNVWAASDANRRTGR